MYRATQRVRHDAATAVERESPTEAIKLLLIRRRHTTTVIATITSGQKGLHLPSHIYLGDRYGLSQPSTVMLEQIRTINQDELDDYIGTVNDKPTLRALEIGIKKTFGLWVYGTNKDDVRCLCPKCVNEYMNSGSFRISRLDPFQKVKEPCDRCNRPGYDYVLRLRHSR